MKNKQKYYNNILNAILDAVMYWDPMHVLAHPLYGKVTFWSVVSLVATSAMQNCTFRHSKQCKDRFVWAVPKILTQCLLRLRVVSGSILHASSGSVLRNAHVKRLVYIRRIQPCAGEGVCPLYQLYHSITAYEVMDAMESALLILVSNNLPMGCAAWPRKKVPEGRWENIWILNCFLRLLMKHPDY